MELHRRSRPLPRVHAIFAGGGVNMNVELTVVSLKATTYDARTSAERNLLIGEVRCSATNGHESYDWTVTNVADVPRIGDKIIVSHEAAS